MTPQSLFRLMLVSLSSMALAAPAAAQLPAAPTQAEQQILSVIEEMSRLKKTYLSVPAEDGRWLRVLAEAVNARHIVEIGTSTGFSGLWFCLALHKTGGKLTTFEMDPGRAATARKHFDQAGAGGLVTIVQGDAHKNIESLKGPIDVVFIDADKEGYTDYLRKLLPLVRPGGLILAHNTTLGSVSEYVKAVRSDPALETVFFNEGGGLGVTLKKR